MSAGAICTVNIIVAATKSHLAILSDIFECLRFNRIFIRRDIGQLMMLSAIGYLD